MIKKLTPLAAIAAATFLLPLAGHAQATTGMDNAGNYGTDYNNQNMGTGFGSFTVTHTGGGSGGSFIGTSGTSIDSTGSKAFGLYANGSGTPLVTITRAFGTALQNPNDSFSTDLRTDFSGSSAGQTFQYNIGPETLTLTSAGYALAGGTVTNNLGQGDFILHTLFTVNNSNAYTFTVTSDQGGSASAMGTLAGTVGNFSITGTNLPNNQYFNNLSITNNIAPTPEPGGLMTLLLGTALLGGVIVARRRRGVTA